MRDEVQIREDHVHDSIDVIEHPTPYLRGNDGWDRPWNQNRNTQNGSAFELRVSDQRDCQPQNGLNRDRKKGKYQSHPDRVPKIAVREDKGVIVEPHEARRGDPVELVFQKRIVKDLEKREADYQKYHEDRGEDQIPRQTPLAL